MNSQKQNSFGKFATLIEVISYHNAKVAAKAAFFFYKINNWVSIINQLSGKELRGRKKRGFWKWMASVILSQTCSFLETTLQSSVLWPTVDPCVSQFSFLLVSLFYFHRREFVISYFNDCPFSLAIFGIILLFCLALIDMVSLSINLLVSLRCAQISVLEGENLLVVKVVYILNDICRHSRRACGSCLQVNNWVLSTKYI